MTINGGAGEVDQRHDADDLGHDRRAGRPVGDGHGRRADADRAVGAGGAWAVSTTTLSEGPHTVVASSTDASQNTGTASQVLTVDTATPAVTIDGGPSRATNDTTPTISGTTTEPGSPTVSVTVGGQTLTAVAAAGGAWTVDAASSGRGSAQRGGDGLRRGRQHGHRQPGADRRRHRAGADDRRRPIRSTSDTSPWTYGTTAEQAGTIVSVTLDGQTLTATVQPGGTWGVSAQTVASGTYTVLASITDAAGNTGTATQSLQIGSVVTTRS